MIFCKEHQNIGKYPKEARLRNAYTHYVSLLPEEGGAAHRAGALSLRGLVLATLGKDEAAVKDFDALIKLQPDRPDGLIKRGSLLFRMGHLERALADFDCSVLILRRQEGETEGGGGGDAAKMSDLYAAVDDVTEAYKLDRANPLYKQHMGELAQKLGYHVATQGPRGAESPLTGEAAQLAQQLLAGATGSLKS